MTTSRSISTIGMRAFWRMDSTSVVVTAVFSVSSIGSSTTPTTRRWAQSCAVRRACTVLVAGSAEDAPSQSVV